jgi:hypothetical protein
VADRQDWATSGPDGQRLGAGGSERERGSAERGAERWAWQHSATRFGSKPNQKYFQTESKFFKFD